MYRFPFHWTLLPAAVASIVISVAISVAGRSLSAEPPAAVVTDEKAARPRQIATPQTDQTTKKAQEPAALKSVPDRLVVLTFDDASASHFHIVRPLLKKYGFGATFFITEGFDFPSNKRDYLTWKQIAQLHQDGFEIGNHTRDHLSITEKNLDSIAEQLEAINRKCRQHQIPAPTSFAYPGNATSTKALAILKQHGIRFARRGGMPEYPYRQGRGFAYQPGLDHPLLIPSAGDARPDWELADLIRAARQARYGRIAVLQFHGVPDTAHSWVSTTADKFEGYLRYLAKERYTVIAMRDLAKYVNPEIVPQNPQGVIEDRLESVAAGGEPPDFRAAANDDELRRWLQNMVGHHRFDLTEVSAATGLDAASVKKAIDKWKISVLPQQDKPATKPLRLLPYPGGRHPRIGFLDGAIRPQRETKLSAFAPWTDGGYAVIDLPEAIWHTPESGRSLLYLAHTHVPTIWDRQNIKLKPLEWQAWAPKTNSDANASGWRVERLLPNKVAFGAEAMPRQGGIAMRLWIRNGSNNPLTGLRVQNCVMLKGLQGFAQQSNDNKLLQKPFAACRSEDGQRWAITAWQRCNRAWGNAHCPCLHSDPQFEDCPPGESRELKGWFSFYQGADIQAEFKRLGDQFPFLKLALSN